MTIKNPHLVISDKPFERTRKPQRGGDGTYERNYTRHSKKIFNEIRRTKNTFKKNAKYNEVSKRYFKVTYPEKLNIDKSDGRTLEKVLHSKIIAGDPKKQSAFISTTANQFDLIFDAIKLYKTSRANRGKSYFAPIEKIGPITMPDKISKGFRKAMKDPKFTGEAILTLFDDLSQREKDYYKKNINVFLKEHNGKVVKTEETSSGLTMAIKSSSKTIEDIATKFAAVQSIDDINQAFVPSSIAGEPLTHAIEVLPNSSNAKVCIFDHGVVEGSRFLDGSILGRQNPLKDGSEHDTDHGTMVSSRIIYGDTLREQFSNGKLEPDVKVLSINIFSRDALGNPLRPREQDLIGIIRKTVRENHKDIKVYNLSINLVSITSGFSAFINDKVSLLAAEIDSLSKKYNVLFVISSGNYPAINTVVPAEEFPKYFKNDETRIAIPSEAILALTVGSMAKRENSISISKANDPSPFTRRGPGFNGYRKPDIVAHGGNLPENWRSIDDLCVCGIHKDGTTLGYGTGTSYSAPLISRVAAKLFEHINSASVDLIRAMIIHFSDYPNSRLKDDEHFLNLMGNGHIVEERLLHSDQWNQTYIYQGKAKLKNIYCIPFHVPKTMIDRKGRNKVKITVTIAFSPETKRTLKTGYCKSHFRAKFCKLNDKKEIVEILPERNKTAMREKYSSVIKFQKTFSAKISAGSWQILVEHESRWTLLDEELPFASVITISDPQEDKKINIYEDIQNEVPNQFRDLIQTQEQIRV